MADPNTQIDWWIAQTWQEAQGGADAESLVAWLHENGLTAISSYTILQAALSCTPDEAKAMVFGHPAWADQATDGALDAAGYTADTLEPELEPDPTFELEDWADEVEEDGPVYGEEGYQAPTPLPAADPDAQRNKTMLVDAYAEADPDVASDEPNTGFGADDTLSAFDSEPLPMADEIGFQEPAAMEPPAATPEPAPAPAAPPPAPATRTAAPVSKMPPATPEERAAVFAAAFGKKPTASPPAAPAADDPPAPSVETAPDQNDPGPAANAETAPALQSQEYPQPDPLASAMQQPLADQPAPETVLPPSGPAADPSDQDSLPPGMKFATSLDRPDPAPEDAEPPEFEAISEPPPLDLMDEVPPLNEIPADFPDDGIGALRADSHDRDLHFGDGDSADDAGVEPHLDLGEEVPPLNEAPADLTDDNDLPPGMRAALARETQAVHDDGIDALPADSEDHNVQFGNRASADDGSESAPVPEGSQMDGDEGDAHHPRKKLLLDPEEDKRRQMEPPSPFETLPEDPKEIVEKLGINFRAGDLLEVGVDPEMTLAAKELGISFRDEEAPKEEDLDETALAAQRLGISFRDEDYSDKPKKHIIAKYMPLLLIIIAMFFLLLIGATFAGDFMAWLKT